MAAGSKFCLGKGRNESDERIRIKPPERLQNRQGKHNVAQSAAAKNCNSQCKTGKFSSAAFPLPESLPIGRCSPNFEADPTGSCSAVGQTGESGPVFETQDRLGNPLIPKPLLISLTVFSSCKGDGIPYGDSGKVLRTIGHKLSDTTILIN